MRVAGVDYPAALTVDAALTLIRTYGSIQDALKVLQSREIQHVLVDSMEIVAVLLKGGAAQLHLTTGETCRVPTADELRIMVLPSEMPEIRGEALKVMADGLRREIEAEGKKKEAHG